MNIILVIILAYLTISVLYLVVFSVASKFSRKNTNETGYAKENKIAVFIAAYKEDGIIVDTAKKALNQEYAADKYEVVIIADSLKAKTLTELKKLAITVVEVSFEKSSKAKAINKTFETLKTAFDITVILDADNVMAPDFLQKISQEFNKGTLAIQGHRVAKNENSNLSLLDGISEEINNNIFRKGHQTLGLSSALIGSGMAFDHEFFRGQMKEIDALGGFDKQLELKLLKANIEIRYLEDAYVFDEKVSSNDVFTNQRTRWIAAQIRFGLSSFSDAIKVLIKEGNWNYFDKSLQFLLPPRLILLGVLIFTAAITLFLNPSFGFYASGLFLLNVLALVFAAPRRYFSKATLKACLSLPTTFFLMLKAFLGFKKAKNNFLHTPHNI
jgi:cellulose synthase/poly-beta-1,6-N-acetylglucosamine synthase-like glycosyltransferase